MRPIRPGKNPSDVSGAIMLGDIGWAGGKFVGSVEPEEATGVSSLEEATRSLADSG